MLYAHNPDHPDRLPRTLDTTCPSLILVYVVLGGIGNIRGSVIATVIQHLLPEMLRGLSNYRMLMYAIVLILAMLFNSAPQFVVMRERLAENPAEKIRNPQRRQHKMALLEVKI